MDAEVVFYCAEFRVGKVGDVDNVSELNVGVCSAECG